MGFPQLTNFQKSPGPSDHAFPDTQDRYLGFLSGAISGGQQCHVARHAHVNSVTPDLRQRSSTHIHYNIARNSHESYLMAEVDNQK